MEVAEAVAARQVAVDVEALAEAVEAQRAVQVERR